MEVEDLHSPISGDLCNEEILLKKANKMLTKLENNYIQSLPEDNTFIFY